MRGNALRCYVLIFPNRKIGIVTRVVSTSPVNLFDPSGLIWLTKDDQTYIWIDDDEYKKTQEKYKDYSVANGAVIQYQGSFGCPECADLSRGDWVQLNANGGVDPVADPTTNIYDQNPLATGNYTSYNLGYRIFQMGGIIDQIARFILLLVLVHLGRITLTPKRKAKAL